MIEIWNSIVEEGNAFPQEEVLSMESGKDFFNKMEKIENFYENLKSLSGFFSSDKNIEKELNDELLIQKIFTGINNNQEAEIKKEENH